MTKEEAIVVMKAGNKVRHESFSDNEWMTIEHGRILFEDGVRCTLPDFWSDRTNPSWNKNYMLWEDWIN